MADIIYNTIEESLYVYALRSLNSKYHEGKAKCQPLFQKTDGEVVVRPLTFEEEIKAIVDAYESGKNVLNNKFTCTGIAYKPNSSKFKLIPKSQDLILLEEQYFLHIPINYADQEGVELDTEKGKYGKFLWKGNILNHPMWCELIHDKHLLKTFRNIAFSKKIKTMGLFIKRHSKEEILKPITIDSMCGKIFGYSSNLMHPTFTLID